MRHRQPAFVVLGLGFLAMGGIISFELDPRRDQVFAQDQTTINILEHIAQLGEATGSYRTDCKTIMEKDGKTTVMDGHLIFKWPNMSREEARAPEDGSLIGLVVFNGHIQWNYIPIINVAFKYHMDALHEDAQRKFGISANYIDENSVQYLKRDKVGMEETYVFEGEPSALITQNDPEHPTKAKVYISVTDGTIRKTALYDQQGRETFSQTCGNVRPDASISDKDFEFTPPEGTRVIDVADVGN